MTKILPLSTLLPIRQLVVTLQAMETVRTGFFHQPALTGFLRFLLNSPGRYEQLIRIDCPESGRTEYHRGENYRFVVIGFSGSEILLATLIDRIKRLPGSARKIDSELPFRNNWRLVSLQDGISAQSVEKVHNYLAIQSQN